MCTVSVIFDYGQRVPENQWTRQSFEEYLQLLEAAKRFDQITNQPDCEDPTKAMWIEGIKQRLQKREPDVR